MAKKKTTPTKPTTYYDETKITWNETETNVFHPIGLHVPDSAMVALAHVPKSQPRWFWRASDGRLIERQYLPPGIASNAFAAQQLAIQWLNARRATPDQPVVVGVDPAIDITPAEVAAVFEMRNRVQPDAINAEMGMTIDESQVAPTGETVITALSQTELSDHPKRHSELDRFIPRKVDPFTGKLIPDDTPHPDALPPVLTHDPSLDDSKDEIVDPQPVRRGRKR